MRNGCLLIGSLGVGYVTGYHVSLPIAITKDILVIKGRPAIALI